MKEKEINVRLNYNGKFQKSAYVGGQYFIATRVEVDTFSYTVLMEFVKDYLHYTEIGGIYISKEKGGWQLVTNDKDLIGLVEGCNDGEQIEFYIDNIVDKEIEPLNQMQPHVMVRPRKNIIEVSPKKSVKRTFVTRQQLQQQNQFIRRSPRVSKRKKEEDVVEKGKESAIVRRKLNLPNDTSRCEKSGENEVVVQKPPLTKYEKDRLDRMKRNNDALEAYGVRKIAASLKEIAGQNSRVEQNNGEDPDEEDEYDPGKDTSEMERNIVSKAKRSGVGRRTRSQAKARAQAPADIEIESESAHVATAIRNEGKKVRVEKEVTSSYRVPALKPTCTKQLSKTINGVPPGSVKAYLALREQQKLDPTPPLQEDDVPQFDVEETTVEEAVKGPRKPRGPTKMVKVHARTAENKVVIVLNKKDQPVLDDQKVHTELSNFVGTLARDNVSLTYVNWHVVPDSLKKHLWEQTLARYVIPEQGRKWVYNTLNAAWRLHKSRFKAKYYTTPKTDAERLAKRPEEISLEDFKVLMAYWADEEVQKLAQKNSARRNLLTETHTMGPKTLAQVRGEMKKKSPDLTTPTDAEVFVETRTRKEGRKYKSNIDKLEKRIALIKKLITSGRDVEADLLVNGDKDHARNWLVGRGSTKHDGQSSGSAAIPTEHYLQELTTKIKHDLEMELEAKVNRKVQENITWVLKKLGDAYPDLKLNIGDFCATVSSDQDDNGTPVTRGATS